MPESVFSAERTNRESSVTVLLTILAAVAINLFPMEWAVPVWTGLAAFGGAIR